MHPLRPGAFQVKQLFSGGCSGKASAKVLRHDGERLAPGFPAGRGAVVAAAVATV